MWNRSLVQVRCMRQGAQGWCTGRWDGEGGRRGVQDGEHMYTNGWFMSMYGKNLYKQYYKVISLQLKLIYKKYGNHFAYITCNFLKNLYTLCRKIKKVSENWVTSHNCHCHKPSESSSSLVWIYHVHQTSSSATLKRGQSDSSKLCQLLNSAQISPVTALLPDFISFGSCPHSLCSSYTGLSVLPQPTGHPILCMGLSLPVMLFHMKQGTSLFTFKCHLLTVAYLDPPFSTASLSAIISALLIPLNDHSIFSKHKSPSYTLCIYFWCLCLLSASSHTGGIFISLHWCVPICLRATPNKHRGAQWMPTKWMNN